jgi:hypothetical protein
MEHFYESLLIDTTDGIQCKVYANSHPDGKIIVKPKYIPVDIANFKGLKKRFLFSKAMTRFNLFNSVEVVEHNVKEIKEKLPDYYYYSESHKNWFLVVPKEKIAKAHNPKQGLKELMKIPESDLDPYLKAVTGIINLILKSGVSVENLGINHSTLLGNYTPGKSDIDIVVFGKENGWKVVNFMETAQDEKLKWKSEDDWRKYYKDRIVSKIFSEDEYVANMVQKKDDGFYDNNVFSIFCIEEPEECWYNWEDQHTPLATIKFQGKVIDHYNSIVRPGYYKLGDSKIMEGHPDVKIKRIVNWSRPFSLQAKSGDNVEGLGLLEEIKTKSGETFHQVTIGYFDAYTDGRSEEEYLKKLLN